MKPYKKITGLAVSSLFVLLFFNSCNKDPLNNLSNEESRIYVSNYDTTASFESYQTFSIEDSVNVIRNDQSIGKKLDSFELKTINAVRQSMKDRGYTEVDRANKPDLAINISEVTNTSTGIFSYPDYWDSYGSFYDPYYWGYGGYGYYAPYMIGLYTIENGGLEIDLLDLKHADANKIQAVWTGLARGEDVFNPDNAASEVKALFDQSPYLKITN
jgi:hypothetical protein